MIGNLGENFFSIAISRKTSQGYLFRPTFTGDKWPTIDFYVEIVSKKTGYFAFFQVKTTTKRLRAKSQRVVINVPKNKINKLAQHLAPTYLVCVHLNSAEPKNSKAYIKTIRGSYKKAISSVATTNELNKQNLLILKREIKEFWKQSNTKQNKIKYSSNF